MYVGLSVPDNLIVTIQTSHHMDTQKPIVEYILANNIKVPFQNPSNPSNPSCRFETGFTICIYALYLDSSDLTGAR